MTRRLRLARFAAVMLAASLVGPYLMRAQTQTPSPSSASQEPQAQQVPDESSVPEEDESEKPRTYVLNPLESERNIKVGNFYFNKSDYRGALSRYEDATRFNPNSAEAFAKVAQAEEKLNHADRARLAWKKVADLAPDSKIGKEAKKKLIAKRQNS